VRVGDGRNTRFWLDVWVGDCSLKNLYPKIYHICSDQTISVGEAAARCWCLRFRRNLGEAEATEWRQLQATLSRQALSNQQDRVCWKVDKKGSYTVRSLYRFIVDPGCRDLRASDVWNTTLPLRIQIFLSMMFHDRLETAVQLKSRKWVRPNKCKLCGVVEDLDHLFFRCPTSQFIWCWVRDALGRVSFPTSLEEFLSGMVGDPGRDCNRTFIFLLAGVTWAIWKRLGVF
jgi:hypothetical protein